MLYTVYEVTEMVTTLLTCHKIEADSPEQAKRFVLEGSVAHEEIDHGPLGDANFGGLGYAVVEGEHDGIDEEAVQAALENMVA